MRQVWGITRSMDLKRKRDPDPLSFQRFVQLGILEKRAFEDAKIKSHFRKPDKDWVADIEDAYQKRRNTWIGLKVEGAKLCPKRLFVKRVM
jgi:hypothetical protein